MAISEETKGDAAILLGGLLWGLFPVITILSYSSLGPLVALTLSTIFSAAFFTILLTVKKKWPELANLEAWKNIVFVALFIGILVYVFMFIGLKYTSPGNASLIGLTEIFFSYLLFNIWKREKFTITQIAGALLMMTGAVVVLSPKGAALNRGDVFILLANMVAPIGNYFQQKARKIVSAEAIMFGRNILTIPFVALLAFLFQEKVSLFDLKQALPFILVNGILLLGLTKILWIEGIHRISVTKANALSSTNPLFTMFFAFLILHQSPTPWQLAAFIPLFTGLILLTRPVYNHIDARGQ